MSIFFQENLKHYGILKNITWILQQICKVPKDFGLYLKIIFWHEILFNLNKDKNPKRN